ncbi:MAG TPA: helix-turn-helix transcriptional regulator [Micromonosporaceae bacterium]|nr:helix-turn-helix transcriptional regulator [Micromonosporaceae bacterium]
MEAGVFLTSAAVRDAVARDDPGTVIRLVRRAADLNQTELGRRCGYSASTISRIERGLPPIYDIDVRRRIGRALHIPPPYLGLAPAQRDAHPDHIPRVVHAQQRAATVMVNRTSAAEGDDPVRRRELLNGMAAAAAAVSTGAWPTPAHAGAGSLDDLLTARGRTPHQPRPPRSVRRWPAHTAPSTPASTPT